MIKFQNFGPSLNVLAGHLGLGLKKMSSAKRTGEKPSLVNIPGFTQGDTSDSLSTAKFR